MIRVRINKVNAREPSRSDKQSDHGMAPRRRRARGNISLLFALLAIPVFGAAGIAIDLARMNFARTELQELIDKAALAAARLNNANDARRRYYDILKSADLDERQCSYNRTRDGNDRFLIAGDCMTSLPTTLAGVFGLKTLDIATHTEVTAPFGPSQFVLTPLNAQGHYDKEVFFKVERPNGDIDTLATIVWDQLDIYANGGMGVGTISVDPQGVVPTGEYRRLWAEMHVDNFLSGEIEVYSSDDPNTSHHLFINGRQTQRNTFVDIGDLLPCGETVEYAWEDSVTGFREQDIFFNVQADCTQVSVENVHIVR